MNQSELESEAISRINSYLAEGFDSPETIVRNVTEMLSDEHEEDAAAEAVATLLPRVIAQRDQQRAEWPKVTDCDRLDAAFDEMNRRGIMARHHFACCNNCAKAEMPDEYQRVGGLCDGVEIHGFVYYHHQDTSRAAEGGGLYLGFGSTDAVDTQQEYEARSLEIFREALDILASHGLKAVWDGTTGKEQVCR